MIEIVAFVGNYKITCHVENEIILLLMKCCVLIYFILIKG